MTFCCAMALVSSVPNLAFATLTASIGSCGNRVTTTQCFLKNVPPAFGGHCSFFPFFFARKMKNVNATLDQVLPQQRKTARTRQNLSSPTSFSHRPSCCAREDRCPSPSPRLFSPLLQQRDFFPGLCCSQLIQETSCFTRRPASHFTSQHDQRGPTSFG